MARSRRAGLHARVGVVVVLVGCCAVQVEMRVTNRWAVCVRRASMQRSVVRGRLKDAELHAGNRQRHYRRGGGLVDVTSQTAG